jgi:nucleotide-binding universal stress UspA family protein
MGHVDLAPSPVPSPFSIKKVIFATEFSQCSENAGRYASMIARRFGADLTVAHSFELTQAAMEVEAKGNGALKSAQRADLEIAIVNEAERLRTGLQHVEAVLLEGDPKQQIPQLASRNEPSLIVLGTEGRGRLSRGIIGSVAEKVMRSTGGPALTVGPHVAQCCDESAPIKRVLYATGLSPAAARGVAYAVGMAEAFHAEMDVLHVIHPEDVEEAGGLPGAQDRFQAEVELIAPQHAEAITKPHGVVATGIAHSRILEHIQGRAIDLQVLSLRRSSHLRLESRVSGAFHIVANGPCPVMTLIG